VTDAAVPLIPGSEMNRGSRLRIHRLDKNIYSDM